MDENEPAAIMNEPNQYNVPNENDRNVQHSNNNAHENVQHENHDQLKMKTMKTLKKTDQNTKTQKNKIQLSNQSNLTSIQQGEDTKPKVSAPNNQQFEY